MFSSCENEFTVKPNKGYEIKTLRMTDSQGKEIEIKFLKLDDTGARVYSFEIPNNDITNDITLYAEFKKIENKNEKTIIEATKESQENINEILKEEISKDKVLQQAVSDKKEIKIEINIENIQKDKLEKTIQEKINKIVKNGNIAQYFDISLLIKVNDETIKEISEPSKELTFTLTIPEELLKEGRKFYIVRVHNGETEKLEATVSGNKIEFKTDKFSTYVLAYEDTISEEKDDTPKTGIDIIMYAAMGICVISLAGIAVKKYSK